MQIVFNDSWAVCDRYSRAAFNAGANTLTIDYNRRYHCAYGSSPEVTADGTFTATLNTTTDPLNNGTGLIGAPPAAALETAGGTSQVITGRDTNPLEVKSIFTALIRLQRRCEPNDEVQTSPHGRPGR